MEQHRQNDWPFGILTPLSDSPAAMREFENFPEIRNALFLERAESAATPFSTQYLVNSMSPGLPVIPVDPELM